MFFFLIPTLPSPFYYSGLCFFILGLLWWIKKISFYAFIYCLPLWPVIYYSDLPEKCSWSLPGSVESEKMQPAPGWINSQVPGWATAAGSCGRQICSTSIHAYSSTWGHNRVLPSHAVCPVYVSNWLSGCFHFLKEQLSNYTKHVCRRSRFLSRVLL